MLASGRPRCRRAAFVATHHNHNQLSPWFSIIQERHGRIRRSSHQTFTCTITATRPLLSHFNLSRKPLIPGTSCSAFTGRGVGDEVAAGAAAAATTLLHRRACTEATDRRLERPVHGRAERRGAHGNMALTCVCVGSTRFCGPKCWHAAPWEKRLYHSAAHALICCSLPDNVSHACCTMTVQFRCRTCTIAMHAHISDILHGGLPLRISHILRCLCISQHLQRARNAPPPCT